MVKWSFLATLLPITCILFTILLNTAGIAVGQFGFVPSHGDATIVEFSLHLLQIKIPTIDNSVSTFQALLYLNNACLNPIDPWYDLEADEGPVCQIPHIAQTYIIRGSPNVTYPAICDSEPSSPLNTTTSPFYLNGQPCDVNPGDDTPYQVSVSTGAGWAFSFFGAISSLLTLLVLFVNPLRKRLPSYADVAATACAAVFYSCASVAITTDAALAVAKVKSWQFPAENEASLGSGFQVMIWGTMLLSLGEMAIVLRSKWWDRNRPLVVPGGAPIYPNRSDSWRFANEVAQLADRVA